MAITQKTLNINCDMGEGYGRWSAGGNDEEMMKYVPTANLACGYHASDPHTMHKTVNLAGKAGIEIGAHVSVPDIIGFGRRRFMVKPEELYDYVIAQIGTLWGFVKAEGLQLAHVKPHGILYTMVGESAEYASAVFQAVRDIEPSLIVIAGGPVVNEVARKYKVRVVPEGYCDINYHPNGFPVCPSVEKEYWETEEVANRAIRLVIKGTMNAIDGSTVRINTPTMCIHGDVTNAVEIIVLVRKLLEENNVKIIKLSEIDYSREYTGAVSIYS